MRRLFNPDPATQAKIKTLYAKMPDASYSDILGIILLAIGVIFNLCSIVNQWDDYFGGTYDITNYLLYLISPMGLILIHQSMLIYHDMPQSEAAPGTYDKKFKEILDYLPVDPSELVAYRLRRMGRIAGLYTLSLVVIQVVIMLTIDYDYSIMPVIMTLLSCLAIPAIIILIQEARA